ncbi:MAG: HPF/RaiA family ribosome-associated protein [Candidatus Zixiibacteriota bacterium]|nr:MAG: HPF/RaiA family ribosome-associated protein [candidate division Zixibacteria bacterium]
MQIPLELSFRNVPKTDAIEALIREKVAKLEQVCDYINSCRVAVEKPQSHQNSGNVYRVRLGITVPPGHEIVVTREPGNNQMHRPLSSVIREAFSAARRQLKELVNRQRMEVKSHPQQEAQAIVIRLFPEEGYGFVQTIDGLEIYFHRNSVINHDFERLQVGTGVRYVAVEGEEGLQATTIQIVNKPGVRRTEQDAVEQELLNGKPKL